MANLRDLRKRRKGAANTKKITRTMELVSSAKLKRAQDAATASRPYAEGLQGLVAELSVASGGVSHPLLQRRTVKKVLILVATSDRGLCGAYNANLVNTALRRRTEHQAAGRQVEFITLAKKAFKRNQDAFHNAVYVALIAVVPVPKTPGSFKNSRWAVVADVCVRCERPRMGCMCVF